MQLYFLILYFFIYGFLGWCTEVAFAAAKERRFVNRGFLNGPICPIYGVGVSAVLLFLHTFENNLIFLYVASVIVVTLIEGITGFAMDKIFHHKWWDYSDIPLNIGGYVCLLFSVIWGAACVFIVKVFQPLVYGAIKFLPHTLGIIMIVIFGGILFSDLYVTASGILKFNKRLEMMEKIAAELREVSDKVGSNIYENVMDTIEIHEEGRKKLEEAAGDIKEKLDELEEEHREWRAERREHAAELRERYAQLAKSSTKVSERLVKAFPKMQSRKHRDILEELKKLWKKGRKRENKLQNKENLC